MADKLIGADALTREIVNSPSDISGYNPVYCNGVAKRQLEILDIILNMNGTTYGEIRAKAVEDFMAEITKYYEKYRVEPNYHWLKEVARQMKGE